MGDTSIQWTDKTWNPVTGCTKVSEGCRNCYAETFAERWRGIKGHHYEQGFDVRLWPNRLSYPASVKKPARIFVNSMSDLFHEAVPEEFVGRVWSTMREARHHTFQVLTKRPARMVELVTRFGYVPENVWLGVSIEDQRVAYRADALDQVRARVRFVSAEPLIGPLDLKPWLNTRIVNWLIIGGESGAGCRPMDPEWAVDLAVQCSGSGCPMFMKQMGGYPDKRGQFEQLAVRRREFPVR